MLQVRLPDFPQQQTFQHWHALTFIRAHLRQQPMRLPATPGATVADRRRPIRRIAQPRGGTGQQLARLQNDAGGEEVLDLIGRAARPLGVLGKEFDGGHGENAESACRTGQRAQDKS